MPRPEPLIVLICADGGRLQRLREPLAGAAGGLRVFPSMDGMLRDGGPSLAPGCVVCDLLEGPTAERAEAAMSRIDGSVPAILLVPAGTSAAVRSIGRAGLVDVIEEPVRPAELVAAVRLAIRLRLRAWEETERLSLVRSRLSRLSVRERSILTLLAGGLANEEIGRCLAIEASSVVEHRRRITAKLGLGSDADLAQQAPRLVERGRAEPRIRTPA